MKLEVECYSGFKADERPVRFRLDERQYLVEEIVDHGTQDVSTKFALMMGVSTSYAVRPRLRRAHGIWCHFVKCRLNGEAATRSGLELN